MQNFVRMRDNLLGGRVDKSSKIVCDGFGCYCFQTDNKVIAGGIRDNTGEGMRWVCMHSHARAVKVWDVSTHQLVRRFFGHQGSVLCLQFDDYKMITGSSDQTIRVWDFKTAECVRVLLDHEKVRA